MDFDPSIFGKLIDTLFDQVAVVDQDFRIRWANRSFADAHKTDSASLTDRSCFEVLNHQDKACFPLDEPCPLRLALETGKEQSIKRTYQDSKGNVEHYSIRAVPLPGETEETKQVVLVLSDITQSIHSENKLLESYRKFQLISDMGDDAIFVLDSDFQVEFANKMASKLTGYSQKEIIHLDFRTLLDDQGRQFLADQAKSGSSEEGCRASARLKIQILNSDPRFFEVCFNLAETGDEKKIFIYMRDLSKRMQMETELRQANTFLSNLIDSSVDGIIAADMKGKIIIFNEGAEKLLGYKADEIINKFNVAGLYPPGVAQDIMRKMRSDDFGGTGKVLPTRIIGIHKNGEHIPVTLSGTTIYQGGKEVATVGIFYDLREILKAEQDLLESKINFRNLFERVRHGIYFSTREGKFVDCNQAMLEMLAYESKDDFLKMNITSDLYVNPEDRATFQKMIERDGFVKDYEVRFKKKDGEPVNVLLTAHVRKDSLGKVEGYQGIIIDVTESRKLEQQLFQSEKLAAMGRLTAQIAHELNNPIYGIMNCLDLIKSEVPESSKKRKFLDMAYEETKRISQLLKSMLKFFRPAEDVKGQVDLNNLIDEVVLFIGKQLAEFRVKVAMELAEDLPTIFASGNQLKQVMLNMIMNAKTAMPKGGNLKLATRRDNGNVIIEITDNGCGIPKENQDQIFEAFFTTKSDVKGVGLGLSVCFGIIREHNGTIEVESEVGQGTTFTISLPIEP